jgi:alkanesulfonate monooxygenase SsuD/methylene tetrahydromethanopterin reductase-like flavin-dependent oxidoreductase (luciferase family)
LSGFQWAFFPYIYIGAAEAEAATLAAEALGGRYRYGGDFVDIVRNYCLLGPVERCIGRLEEYVAAGARYIIFSVTGPKDERAYQLETIAREIIPHFRRS